MVGWRLRGGVLGVDVLGLGEVINEFLSGLIFRIGQFEFELSFLGAQDDRLAFHAPDHVEGSAGLAAQGHLQDVLFDARFHGFAQLGLYLKEAVCRAKTFDALMRPPVIVILDPELDAFAGRFEALELSAFEELLPDRCPEALDLAQGHGMMRPGFEVRHAVFLKFGFKPRRAAPGGVLPSIVGQHLLGWLELADTLPIHFDHRLRRRTAEQIRCSDKAGVVIEESDEVRILATQSEGEDVRLPHLIGRSPFEEPWPGHVPSLGCRRFIHQLRLMQTRAHRFGAGFQKEQPAQPLGDALHSERRVLFLDLQYPLGHCRAELGLLRMRAGGLIMQTGFAELAVMIDPAIQGLDRNPQLLGDRSAGKTFLQKEADRAAFELKRKPVRRFRPAAPSPLGGRGALFHVTASCTTFVIHVNTPSNGGVSTISPLMPVSSTGR